MSTTKRCHIIRQGFMKNFSNNEKLHYFEMRDWEFQYMWERNTDSIWYENHVFNYFLEHENRKWWVRFDELEVRLWTNFEDKLTKILDKILGHVEQGSFIFTKENKTFFLDLMWFSLWKIQFHKLWKEKNEKNNQKDILLLTHLTNEIISMLDSFFNELLKDKYIRKIIYSQEDTFYFWDSIFHIKPNPKWVSYNDLTEFSDNLGSNVFFPVSKNIALVIESIHPDANLSQDFLEQNIVSIWNWWILWNTHRSKWPSWVYSETMEWTALYRIIQNCDWYLAWPDKRVIDLALAWYKTEESIHLYQKDPIIKTIDKKTKRLLCKISFFRKIFWNKNIPSGLLF